MSFCVFIIGIFFSNLYLWDKKTEIGRKYKWRWDSPNNHHIWFCNPGNYVNVKISSRRMHCTCTWNARVCTPIGANSWWFVSSGCADQLAELDASLHASSKSDALGDASYEWMQDALAMRKHSSCEKAPARRSCQGCCWNLQTLCTA